MNKFFNIIKVIIFFMRKFFIRMQLILFSIFYVLTSRFFIITFIYVACMFTGLSYLEQIYHVPSTMLLTAFYLVLSYYYYGQKIYLENKEKLLMPGEWILEINKNSKIIDEQHKSYKGIQEMLYNFKDLLVSKDDLIKRYQEGYDEKIYKKFLLRLINIRRSIDKCKDKNDEELKKGIKNLSTLMEEALEECGVEVIPENLIIGKQFIDLGNLVQENPSEITTSDRSQDGLVAAINVNGYKLLNAENLTVISGSKVTIMQYSE